MKSNLDSLVSEVVTACLVEASFESIHNSVKQPVNLTNGPWKFIKKRFPHFFRKPSKTDIKEVEELTTKVTLCLGHEKYDDYSELLYFVRHIINMYFEYVNIDIENYFNEDKSIFSKDEFADFVYTFISQLVIEGYLTKEQLAAFSKCVDTYKQSEFAVGAPTFASAVYEDGYEAPLTLLSCILAPTIQPNITIELCALENNPLGLSMTDILDLDENIEVDVIDSLNADDFASDTILYVQDWLMDLFSDKFIKNSYVPIKFPNFSEVALEKFISDLTSFYEIGEYAVDYIKYMSTEATFTDLYQEKLTTYNSDIPSTYPEYTKSSGYFGKYDPYEEDICNMFDKQADVYDYLARKNARSKSFVDDYSSDYYNPSKAYKFNFNSTSSCYKPHYGYSGGSYYNSYKGYSYGYYDTYKSKQPETYKLVIDSNKFLDNVAKEKYTAFCNSDGEYVFFNKLIELVKFDTSVCNCVESKSTFKAEINSTREKLLTTEYNMGVNRDNMQNIMSREKHLTSQDFIFLDPTIKDLTEVSSFVSDIISLELAQEEKLNELLATKKAILETVTSFLEFIIDSNVIVVDPEVVEEINIQATKQEKSATSKAETVRKTNLKDEKMLTDEIAAAFDKFLATKLKQGNDNAEDLSKLLNYINEVSNKLNNITELLKITK